MACERANNCELDWEILQEVCRSELQLAARGALCTETEMSRSYRCTNEVYDCDESRTREMSSLARPPLLSNAQKPARLEGIVVDPLSGQQIARACRKVDGAAVVSAEGRGASELVKVRAIAVIA